MEIGTKVRIITEGWGDGTETPGKEGVIVPVPSKLKMMHFVAGEDFPMEEIAVRFEDSPTVFMYFEDELEVIQ